MTVLHVVGAGIAGLAAALRAVEAGVAVRVWEASPHPGGRCRTVETADGFTHDNGTHALVGANPRALDFLARIGARANWIEPEPEGLPVFDARDGSLRRVGLSPMSWLTPLCRPAGLGLADLPRLARLAMPLSDRPIGPLFAGRPLLDSFIEPLTVAVLNTPVATASALRLGRALRRVVRPGGARLFVARHGLGPDLVAPAIATLAGHGVRVAYGARLRGLRLNGGRIAGLDFAGGGVAVGSGESVLLALPPWEIARLLPSLPVPQAHEPIVNVHFPAEGPTEPRFVGLIGTVAQWVLARRDHVSVTISAAGEAATSNPEGLDQRIWSEIAPALTAAGVQVERHGGARVVKEKRATIRQDAGLVVSTPRLVLRNLALAGDWLGRLPATIESAVTSGEEAVAALGIAQRAGRPVPALAAREAS